MKKIKDIRDAGEYVVELVRAYDSAKSPVFAFVLLQKTYQQNFRENLAKNIKLSDYGVILASGAGHEPSPEVLAEVQKKIGN